MKNKTLIRVYLVRLSLVLAALAVAIGAWGAITIFERQSPPTIAVIPFIGAVSPRSDDTHLGPVGWAGCQSRQARATAWETGQGWLRGQVPVRGRDLAGCGGE